MTGILVVGSLADVGARYTYVLFGWDGAAESKPAITALAVAYIVVLTAICVIGTELSARLQNVMILAQVGRCSCWRASRSGRSTPAMRTPESIEPSSLLVRPVRHRRVGRHSSSSLLIGVFIYWGWESAVNLDRGDEGFPHVLRAWRR